MPHTLPHSLTPGPPEYCSLQTVERFMRIQQFHESFIFYLVSHKWNCTDSHNTQWRMRKLLRTGMDLTLHIVPDKTVIFRRRIDMQILNIKIIPYYRHNRKTYAGRECIQRCAAGREARRVFNLLSRGSF